MKASDYKDGEWTPDNACFQFVKWVIDAQGRMFETETPMEMYLGWHWQYFAWSRRCCIAWSHGAGGEPYNKYWDVMRNPNIHPRLRGTVVIFRHWGHCEPLDVHPKFTKHIPEPDLYLKKKSKCLVQ